MRRSSRRLPFELQYYSERRFLNDGRAPQTSTWVQRQKLVSWRSILQSQQRHIRWKLHCLSETAGCEFLRSQFISHRCRQQKRPDQLQVKGAKCKQELMECEGYSSTFRQTLFMLRKGNSLFSVCLEKAECMYAATVCSLRAGLCAGLWCTQPTL